MNTTAVEPYRGVSRRRLISWSVVGAVLFGGLFLSYRDDIKKESAEASSAGVVYFVGAVQGSVGPDRSYRLYALSPADGSFREITLPVGPALTADIAVSPDGRFLAYSNDVRISSRNIYVIGVDASGRRQVTRSTSPRGFPQEFHPDWSPDGKRIVFSSTRCCDVITPTVASLGNYAIHVVNVDGSDIRQLTNGKTFAWHPTWSPDGSAIAYETAFKDPANIQVWLIGEDGGGNRVLTNNGRVNEAPAWSPAGDQLAFVSRALGAAGKSSWQIRAIDPDGRSESVLYDCAATCSLQTSAIDWSPDGKHLIFTYRDPADLGAPGRLGVIASDGKGFRTVDTGAIDVVEVSWGSR